MSAPVSLTPVAIAVGRTEPFRSRLILALPTERRRRVPSGEPASRSGGGCWVCARSDDLEAAMGLDGRALKAASVAVPELRRPRARVRLGRRRDARSLPERLERWARS